MDIELMDMDICFRAWKVTFSLEAYHAAAEVCNQRNWWSSDETRNGSDIFFVTKDA